MQNNIAVIVVTYKTSKRILIHLKNSLSQNNIGKDNVFLSNNDSNNLGYGGGLNRVLRKISKKFDYFLIVNPDVALGKECIKYLLEAMKENSVGIVGPRIINKSTKTFFDGGKIDKIRYSSVLESKKIKGRSITEKLKHVDYVSGSVMLIKKEIFTKFKLFFPEDYFLYYEELDFCSKVKRIGFNLIISPKAIAYHEESVTIGKDSPAMQYYLARNHLLFVERFAPIYIKIRELLRLPKTLYEARDKKFELIGIRDYLLRKFGRSPQILSKVDIV